jgi:hypothetical protein
MSLGFMLFNSLVSTGSKEYVWLETEEANEITNGLDIVEDEKASEGKAIVSRLRSHQIEAFASYTFNIVQPGEYLFWARAYWPGGCSNSYKIKIDNYPQYTFGNDNLLNVWHWIAKGQFELKKGKHTLNIWNDEYLAQLDRILMTSDPYYIPSGVGQAADFNIDFQGGIPDFAVLKNKKYFELQGESEKILYLKPVMEGNMSRVIFSKINKGNFVFEFDAKHGALRKDHNLVILFNYLNKNNLHRVILRDHSTELQQVVNGKSETLATVSRQNQIADPSLMKYSLVCIFPEISVKINDILILRSGLNDPINGNTGLLSATGDLYIRNISNTSEVRPLYAENFFSLGVDKLTRDDAKIRWEIRSGDWNWIKNKVIMSLEGKGTLNDPAAVIFGRNYWQNYSVETAIQINSKGAGVFFYYQDGDNYYLLKVLSDKKKLVLLSVKDKKENLIQETDYPFSLNEWYKIRITRFEENITVNVDDKTLMEVNDRLFRDGKAGLWSSGSDHANLFDDISIVAFEPDKKERHANHIREYNFEMREHAGLDFCDWEKSGTAFSGRNVNDRGHYLVFEKDILEQKTIKNKKIFYGNTKVDWNISRIPRDIDVVSQFCSWSNGLSQTYDFVISRDRVTILKNMKNIYSVPVPGLQRNNVAIAQLNGRWIVKNNKGLLVEFKGEAIDSTKLAFGFSGIGKGEMVIHHINIEDQIEYGNQVVEED